MKPKQIYKLLSIYDRLVIVTIIVGIILLITKILT